MHYVFKNLILWLQSESEVDSGFKQIWQQKYKNKTGLSVDLPLNLHV